MLFEIKQYARNADGLTWPEWRDRLIAAQRVGFDPLPLAFWECAREWWREGQSPELVCAWAGNAPRNWRERLWHWLLTPWPGR